MAGLPRSSVLVGNLIGLISTPPMPASFIRRSSRANSVFSTLSPFHHQRTKGRWMAAGSLKSRYRSDAGEEGFPANAGNVFKRVNPVVSIDPCHKNARLFMIACYIGSMDHL